MKAIDIKEIASQFALQAENALLESLKESLYEAIIEADPFVFGDDGRNEHPESLVKSKTSPLSIGVPLYVTGYTSDPLITVDTYEILDKWISSWEDFGKSPYSLVLAGKLLRELADRIERLDDASSEKDAQP
jgi:hypothetical protein